MQNFQRIWDNNKWNRSHKFGIISVGGTRPPQQVLGAEGMRDKSAAIRVLKQTDALLVENFQN